MYLRSIFALIILAGACVPFHSGAQYRKLGPVRSFNHDDIPAPSGMVYVPGGSIVIRYNSTENDSFNTKKFSLSAYFIDKTEVTNRQYREFLNWVIDSVAVTQYLKDDKYFQKSNRDSSAKFINWSNVKHKSLFGSKSSDVQSRLQPMYVNGVVNKELYNFSYNSLKPSNGSGSREFAIETVNVYPDTKVWATDFPNSQTDLMVQEYFTNPVFDDYPVVGVTWKQAKAFAAWRTMVSARGGSKYMQNYHLPYNLPTEAQWVHAAQGHQGIEGQPDSIVVLRDSKGRYNANFKQEEGDYTEDGSSYTVPVLSYAPNEYGIYNMLGNVAEWVLDAYNVSAWAFVHDQNPVLDYDAADSEPDIMRSKVVRGGSWKDNAQSVNPNSRNYEVQDVPHSYIGFRCVMPAPEIITRDVITRKRRDLKPAPAPKPEKETTTTTSKN
jgi:sulfatase modifying factor 1